MARRWTRVKSEKHALGLTDSARVAQLKAEALQEAVPPPPPQAPDEHLIGLIEKGGHRPNGEKHG